MAEEAGHARLALLVVGQDLELDRQVDLADGHVVGNGDHRGGEVEDGGDAGGHHAVGHLLRVTGRDRDDADGDAPGGYVVGERVEVPYFDSGDGLAHLPGVDVVEAGEAEAALAEAAVVG